MMEKMVHKFPDRADEQSKEAEIVRLRTTAPMGALNRGTSTWMMRCNTTKSNFCER
jgi:hypothetical protein